MHLSMIFTELVRWALVLLALYILLRCIRSLLTARGQAEVWAYVRLIRPRVDDLGRLEDIDGIGDAAASIAGTGEAVSIDRSSDVENADYTAYVTEAEVSEQSVPLTHWENVIGRSASCDVTSDDDTMSRTHGILMRDMRGDWTYQDLGSKNGSYINDKAVETPHEPVPVAFGDRIRMGLTTLILVPVSIEERDNNRRMRRGDMRPMSPGPTIAALTLFQLLAAFQLAVALPEKALPYIFLSFGGLMALMWLYTGILRAMRRTAYEMDAIAFFLSTLSLAVVASSNYRALPKQTAAIAMGVAAMLLMCLILRDLRLAKKLRWLLLAGAVLLLIVNLVAGRTAYGARNWIEVGGFTFQPSELVKVAFIWVGAGTLDELFRRGNLTVFMLFSAFCFASLALMADFGTAIIFFVTFVVIAFLRSGDFSKLVLFLGGALAGGLLILRFKPYIADRFSTWGHVWEAAFVDGAGYQQSRAMSAAASGGLVGVGAGEGWLKTIAAADTDMVFPMLIEEWGLLIALLAVACIVTLAVFAVGAIMEGRSTFYTICACGAASLFVFQTMLNVFGSVDLLPFTGVTFPFVSNGGTSMLASWALLAFLKSADTRERASLAVKAGEKL